MTKSYSFKEDEYFPQNNGDISNSITQSWTQQALECYSINCNCSKCSLSSGHYSFICQMPKVIDALVKNNVPKLKII